MSLGSLSLSIILPSISTNTVMTQVLLIPRLGLVGGGDERRRERGGGGREWGRDCS